MAHFPRCVPSQKLLIKEQAQEFLKNPQTSVENSLEFLKKITVIAVSNITFGRKIFPEDAYVDEQVDGQQIKILKGLDAIPDTRLMIAWIKFANELVSQQYLQKIILVFETNDSDEDKPKTLETYVFNYNYDEEKICFQLYNEVNSSNVGKSRQGVNLPADIAKAVLQLTRSIDVITSKLAPLPNTCKFSLRLELHEDTPDEAFEQSQLFKAIDTYDISFPSEGTKWKLGKVPTKFTTFTVSIKSLLLEPDSEKQHEEEEDEFVETSQPAFQQIRSYLHN